MSNQTDENVRALRALVLAADLFRHAVAGALGVGSSDVTAMSQLRAAGKLNARELAGRTGLTPPTVTALLRRLEAAGLAERSPHPTDRRQVVVTLTDEGNVRLDRSERWLIDVLGHMNVQSDETASVLVALRAALDLQAAQIRRETEGANTIQQPTDSLRVALTQDEESAHDGREHPEREDPQAGP